MSTNQGEPKMQGLAGMIKGATPVTDPVATPAPSTALDWAHWYQEMTQRIRPDVEVSVKSHTPTGSVATMNCEPFGIHVIVTISGDGETTVILLSEKSLGGALAFVLGGVNMAAFGESPDEAAAV